MPARVTGIPTIAMIVPEEDSTEVPSQTKNTNRQLDTKARKRSPSQSTSISMQTISLSQTSTEMTTGRWQKRDSIGE